jgi:VWFA-related protein
LCKEDTVHRPFVALSATALCLALVPSTRARQAEPAPPQAPEFRAGTAVVVLDVVVRDKRGRHVSDLTADEVQVLENGEPCQIQSFRLVEPAIERGEGGAVAGAPVELQPPSPEGAGTTDATRLPLNLVTLVFDRLEVESNALARKAALEFVDEGMTAQMQVAVFKIGQRMAVVQQYTSDKDRLRQAIELATSGTDLVDTSLTEKALKAQRDVARASATPTPPEQASGEASSPTGVGAGYVSERGPERDERRVVADALRLADSLQRQMEGEWSLYPLMALAKAQARLPGRKTLLFFSAGLQVPSHLDDVFRGVISEANRANVSFYSIDARGLRARSDIQNSAQMLRQAATTSQTQQMKARGEPTTIDEMRIMDTAGDSLRLNLQQTLQDLAEGTGGFLVANANDFGKSVDRLAADIRGYYEITYAPSRSEFDGGFRKIEIKVARKDVSVQSRSGYFALPPEDRIVLPYEVPLLAALAASKEAHDFEHEAGLTHFAPGPDGVESQVLVEVPLGQLDFEQDKKAKQYRLNLLTMAAIKDEGGQLVERFSDEYPIVGPLDKIGEVKAAHAVLRRSLALAPGRYTLESVAMLRDGSRSSVGRQPFEVPAAASGPAVSSLVLIDRADPLPEGAAPPDDPLVLEGMRVVPHFEGAVSKAAMPNLSFLVKVYPKADEGPVGLTLQLVRDGKVVGQASPETPAPDAQGRIAYMGTLPSSGFAPGTYEVRVTASQISGSSTASTTFDLVP